MDIQNMQEKQLKCVMVIDEELPLGMIANTAGIMGITLGKHFPEIVGDTVKDSIGNNHLGITKLPVPILKSTKETLQGIRCKLYQEDFQDLLVVDFSDVAQQCNDYDDYVDKVSYTEQEDIHYLGLAICGDKKKVNKLTGSLPLLR